MRIYYFGKLIKDTENPLATAVETQQTAFDFDSAPAPKKDIKQPNKPKTGMDSIGDILKELDLTVDSFSPRHLSHQGA